MTYWRGFGVEIIYIIIHGSTKDYAYVWSAAALLEGLSLVPESLA